LEELVERAAIEKEEQQLKASPSSITLVSNLS